MVEIDSNAILVEPITSQNDQELAHAYKVLMTRLQRAGIVPKKHILNSKVSEATKTIIKDENKNVDGTHTPRMPPPKCSRGRNMELQIPFPKCVGRRSQQFPIIIMGAPTPTDGDNTQLVATIQCNPNGISLHTHLCGPLGYSKMLLAPMGWWVQVHRKMGK
jgi:hypothetical protein